MRYKITILFLLFICGSLFSQSVGDTIKVKALNYSSSTRDTVVQFPDNDVTFERIILAYNMRCKGAQVSTASERNKGCGEWDYSNNTFVVDSNTIETLNRQVDRYFITDFTEDKFPYVSEPTYDYVSLPINKPDNIVINSEESYSIGSDTIASTISIPSDQELAKNQYLIKAEDLITQGFTEGEINALSFEVMGQFGISNFLRLKMKHTSREELGSMPEFGGWTEVVSDHYLWDESNTNRLLFSTPFEWDGSSNIILELSHNNLISGPNDPTSVAGYKSNEPTALGAFAQQELLLVENAYIECDEYKGVLGSQNRTIEAWINPEVVNEGEICSWGTNTSSEKYVFRLKSNGQLRVEINGGGVESEISINQNEWQHVAMVQNGDNLQDISFYVNGEKLVNTLVNSLTINTASGSNVRVSRGINNRYLQSFVDEVRIWDTSLDQETIQNWMRMNIDENHPNYENLQLNFTFDETSGQEVLDHSGNDRNATIVGSPIRTKTITEDGFFKEFESLTEKPQITLYRGEYEYDLLSSNSNLPVSYNSHYVIEKEINYKDSNQAFSDEIILNDAAVYYHNEEEVYDINGDLIDVIENTPDDTLLISLLDYDLRFPYYVEILSFVTPYGIGLDLGENGQTWYYDITQYESILRNDTRFLMTMGGQYQEEMDVEFWFIVGEPMRDVVDFKQVYQGVARLGSANINNLLAQNSLPPVTVPLESDVDKYLMYSTVTGHGSQGEFEQNGGQIYHNLYVDDFPVNSWTVSQECSFNPIYPQGGSWIFDRQGWCPGETSYTEIFDLTEYIGSLNETVIDYEVSEPDVVSGDYRYLTSHQLVGYGPLNHNIDVRILDVKNPSSKALYSRVNPYCGDPIVVVQNSGKETINSLAFEYILNDGQLYDHTWEGELESEETIEITLPDNGIFYNLEDGINTLAFDIVTVNGAFDDYEYNNRFTTYFEAPLAIPNEFILRTKTNLFAGQNMLKLYDGDGDLKFTNTLSGANTIYKDTMDMTGCITLEMNDLGNDGLYDPFSPSQGAGYLRILNMNGQKLMEFEPDFGGGLTFHFMAVDPTFIKEETLEEDITLSPNPVSDYLQVELENVSDSELTIMDMTGSTMNVQIEKASDSQYKVNTSSLIPGMYMLRIRKGNQSISRKFIKI